MSLHALVANVVNCNIVVSEFELQSRYYAHLGNVWTPLPPELLHHCYSSTRMALALNNPQMLMCHWEKKPNQTKSTLQRLFYA